MEKSFIASEFQRFQDLKMTKEIESRELNKRRIQNADLLIVLKNFI